MGTMINKQNIVAIIQSRMGSSRLPNKAMLSLHGKPIIEWVYRRVSASKLVNNVIVAIPTTKVDDVLDNFLKEIGANVFRGSEADVLERFYLAAKQNSASHIIRICADNPFIDGEEIDNLIKYYLEHNFDYAYNHVPLNNKYPDGFGAEIISFDILEKMYLLAKSPSQREHLLNYLWDNKNSFSIGTFDPSNKVMHHPELKFDIDTIEDYISLSLLKGVNLDTPAFEIVKIKLAGEK
jgi:spore coat polysaccharide biosynthesis protein SpsF